MKKPQPEWLVLYKEVSIQLGPWLLLASLVVCVGFVGRLLPGRFTQEGEQTTQGAAKAGYYVALYAKEWSRNFSMDGLNTYTLVLLTIFYFQKHKLLPCIHSLQNKCTEPMFVSHWQANFERKSLEELKIARIPETEAEQQIVKFFSFYGSRFCFETRVVCPFLGWAPKKEDFDPLDSKIPLGMENLQQYYNKIDMKEAHPVNDLLSYLKPMVVQDPFELNHNVAKGISPGDVDRFRKFCALTATLLDEVLNEAA